MVIARRCTVPARILIVENELETAAHLRDILMDFGYVVTGLVSSGPAAMARAQNDAPDLALLDVCIPGEMDGANTARALREKFNIPVIFVNSLAEPQALRSAEIAEPLGYLTKPFKRAQLQANIEIALYKHREDLKSKERVESLLAALRALGAGVLAVSRDEAVTLLNPAAEVWTGWGSSEALGRSFHEVFPLVAERNGERVYAPVAEVLATGAITELGDSILLLGSNGGKRPVEGSIAPIRDHRGEISGAVIVFRDRSKSSGRVRPDPERLADRATVGSNGCTLVAASPAMQHVLQFARRVAESETNTILLQGESGTGKDVLARFMHQVGSRRDRPFVPLSCAAIPDTLLESEMFGYEKGAFTDAVAQKPGILEIASGGTVFLDEIGDMPVSLQAKMLRVLEEQTFRRLGGLRDIRVDLRVMAASNRKLAEAVDQGKFRLDLYYRLNVIQVLLPPLRERRDDIVPLAKHFVGHYNHRFQRALLGLTTGAALALREYDWPGNVRELRNTIERAVLLEDSDWVQASNLRLTSEGTSHWAPVPRTPPEQSGPAGTLEETEKRMLIEALDKTSWNQARAALMLGISRDTLRYKIKKFNLPRPTALGDMGSSLRKD
jgi:PAS domain S-box-containing protein